MCHVVAHNGHPNMLSFVFCVLDVVYHDAEIQHSNTNSIFGSGNCLVLFWRVPPVLRNQLPVICKHNGNIDINIYRFYGVHMLQKYWSVQLPILLFSFFLIGSLARAFLVNQNSIPYLIPLSHTLLFLSRPTSFPLFPFPFPYSIQHPYDTCVLPSADLPSPHLLSPPAGCSGGGASPRVPIRQSRPPPRCIWRQRA